MVGLKIELGKKNITLIVLLVAVLVVGVVYALTPGVAPNPGHLITEVAPPAGCGAGQVLKWSGSSWGCVVLPVDTDTNTWRPAQKLAISGQTLSITDGGSVTLPGSTLSIVKYSGGGCDNCPCGYHTYQRVRHCIQSCAGHVCSPATANVLLTCYSDPGSPDWIMYCIE